MAVIYDLVFRNNVVFPVSYMCFGLLNRLDDSSNLRYNFYDNRSQALGCSDNATTLLRNYSVSDLMKVRFSYRDYIKNYSTASTFSQMEENFKTLLKQILSELKIVRGAYFLDEDLGVFTVTVENNPADKVLFLLQVARNLARISNGSGDIHSTTNGGISALHYMMDRGFSALESLVFSELFNLGVEFDYSQSRSNPTRTLKCSPRYPDESTLFNHATLGDNGIIALLSQNDDYNPWFQGTFSQQGNGYFRDSHFSSDGIPSPVLGADYDLSSDDYYDDDDEVEDDLDDQGYYFYSSYKSRRLCDWASQHGDRTAFHNNHGSTFNDTFGFVWSANCVRDVEGLITSYQNLVNSVRG